ncbi:NAD-dependent epimerase/dehydratase family protein [Pirellulaceae bacterium SH467]
MRFLVTGGTGFLGRQVVACALDAGHQVRVLARRKERLDYPKWQGDVEWFYADLSIDGELEEAFEGIDCVLHLAAVLSGTEQEQFDTAVDGTQRLLNAMSQSDAKRIVVVSSLSVYDYDRVGPVLTESSPLIKIDDEPYGRDAYARSKRMQEQVARDLSSKFGIQLCIIRPGFIYGLGSSDIAGLGFKVGPVFFRVSGRNRLPLTYVENAADAIVCAGVSVKSDLLCYNLIDSCGECPKRYTAELIKWGKRSMRVVPLPYSLGLGGARVASFLCRLVARNGMALPGILIPTRFAARFKPIRFSNDSIVEGLKWRPKISFEESLHRTFFTNK